MDLGCHLVPLSMVPQGIATTLTRLRGLRGRGASSKTQQWARFGGVTYLCPGHRPGQLYNILNIMNST